MPEAGILYVKTDVKLLSIKVLVGERGFEPPTPWSRTRCSTRLSHSPNLQLEGRLRTERLLADAFVSARELQQSVPEERAPTPAKPYTASESRAAMKPFHQLDLTGLHVLDGAMATELERRG